jgi:hypothetical protein
MKTTPAVAFTTSQAGAQESHYDKLANALFPGRSRTSGRICV